MALAGPVPDRMQVDPRCFNIMVADEHPIMLHELVSVASSIGPGVKAHGTGDLSAFRAHASAHPLDMALICLDMPGMGLSGFAELRRDFPELATVVLSSRDDPPMMRSVLRLGAAGFISKTEIRDVFLQALRLVQAGGIYVPARALDVGGLNGELQIHPNSRYDAGSTPDAVLTPRQSDVLDALLHGWSNKAIARELKLSEGTVKCHVAEILRRSGARNRTEVVANCRPHSMSTMGPFGR